MTPTPPHAIPAEHIDKWTPAWSPDHTDPSLPPLTLITDPNDESAYTAAALASHHPRLGRIAVHPTPLATAPAYLAHDLTRALGKHLPPPHTEPPWWTGNAEAAWRVTAAWTQALHINHYIICRAHRITGRHLEHLMALRERTRTRLTLVVSGPPPAALTALLKAVVHHRIDTLQAAHQHVHTSSEQSLTDPSTAYPWWHRAPFPLPDDEPRYALPPRPRHPTGGPTDITTSSRGTPTDLPPAPQTPPAIALPALADVHTASPHHETVARRIHTHVAHPVHAAAVAIRALTGYGTDQLSHLTVPTPQRPRADLPAELPDWARLLLEAARIHTELEGYNRSELPAHLTGAHKPFRLTTWEQNDVAHATDVCRLSPAPATRRLTRRKSP
ncbi:hypothetical protein [Streptomyces sp. NPDC055794]